MPEVKKSFHVVNLIRRFKELADSVQLNDEQEERMREFMLYTDKTSYVAGNCAGIYWARTGKNKANAI